MSTAGGEGAANDPEVVRDQAWWNERRRLEREIAEAEDRAPAAWTEAVDRADQLRAELARLTEPTPEEKAKAREVAALHHRIYDEQSRIEGTREHAAHRDALIRAFVAARASVGSADTAIERARAALAGAEDAKASAVAQCDTAELALADFAGPDAVQAAIDGMASDGVE